MSLSEELSRLYPDRAPGTAGSLGATRWLIDKMRLYGFKPQVDGFDATIPGRGRVLLRNVLFTAGPQNADAIVVMAHRDDSGLGRGRERQRVGHGRADRARARRTRRRPAPRPQPVGPQHRLIFLSTDGGAFGGLGAARFAAALPGPEPGPRSRQPRLDRRQGKASPRAGGRPASLAGAAPGRERGRADHRAERDRAGPDERARAAHRSRLPVQPLRAGAARRPRDSGDHDHDQRQPPTGVVRGHARSACTGSS